MHPGPKNEGIEIAGDVASGGHSIIEEQVTNGVAVRMALLFLLIAGHSEEGTHPANETQQPRNRRATDIKDPSHAAR